MLPAHHTLCHCEVNDYDDFDAVKRQLREPKWEGTPSLCPRCHLVRCQEIPPAWNEGCFIASPSMAASAELNAYSGWPARADVDTSKWGGRGGRAGTCGMTSFGGDCESGSDGAWPANASGIYTLGQCAARCRQCSACNHASFSYAHDE
eukprot:3360371-Prymnesium_polylepis.1